MQNFIPEHDLGGSQDSVQSSWTETDAPTVRSPLTPEAYPEAQTARSPDAWGHHSAPTARTPAPPLRAGAPEVPAGERDCCAEAKPEVLVARAADRKQSVCGAAEADEVDHVRQPLKLPSPLVRHPSDSSQYAELCQDVEAGRPGLDLGAELAKLRPPPRQWYHSAQLRLLALCCVVGAGLSTPYAL